MSTIRVDSSPPFWAALLLPQVEAIGLYSKALSGMADNPLPALARAIACSQGWPSDCGAVIVVWPSPKPALAVLGRFREPEQSWLRGQIQTVHQACGALRFVDQERVAEDCRTLADNLRTILGDEGLASAVFTAIPQGGLVVLNLLADFLGLTTGQMNPPFPPDRPLVIVDDCTLSGARFFQFLRKIEHPSVIFATLYAHPELRAAIIRREPRVAACLSAQDLGGQQIAETGATEDFYWSGNTEALCFPWNEPDRTFWNPAAQRWDLAWRIVPPELCLKNRPAPGTQPIPVQIRPEGLGPLRPSERALFAEIEGGIALFNLVTGQGFSLGGIGSDLWKALVRLGDLDAAVAELSREYDAPEETVRADARRFTDDLLSRGLLEIREIAAPSLAF